MMNTILIKFSEGFGTVFEEQLNRLKMVFYNDLIGLI